MLRRTKPLAPGGPLKRTGIRPFSAKAQATRTAQKDAHAAAIEASNGTCFSCGRWAPLDPSHLFPQGMNKLLRANPLNLVAECRPCHELFEHKKAAYARQYPEAFAEKLRRMKVLDPQRHAFFCMKNPALVK